MGLIFTVLSSVVSCRVDKRDYDNMQGLVGEEPSGRGRFGIRMSFTVTFVCCISAPVQRNIITGASDHRQGCLDDHVDLHSRSARLASSEGLMPWRSNIMILEPIWAETLKFKMVLDESGFGLDAAFFCVMGMWLIVKQRQGKLRPLRSKRQL